MTPQELPTGLFRELAGRYDADGSGELSAAEYAAIQRLMGSCNNGMIAVRPGGSGLDRTDDNLLWQVKKSIPRTSSPLYYQGRLYAINDGGVLACLDATTGRVIKSGRTPGRGKYFGSPVLGDGKLYFASDRGELTVVTAEPDWELLSFAEFDEPIYPTPAIAAGRLYVRTASRLFCFGE